MESVFQRNLQSRNSGLTAQTEQGVLVALQTFD
jgi:hypothetical protein